MSNIEELSDKAILGTLEDLIEEAIDRTIAIAIGKKYAFTKKHKKERKRLYALMFKHLHGSDYEELYKIRTGKVLK